ncbi:MAG: polysaccharide deacetylase family protein [Clostridia bacterium]|nr:polysaccharide deacetylase family protein [Clostridia bacterium]
MYMKSKDGKSKVLTLSYDDGVVQDIRLIGIMDKYGIKGTFNINSGLYLAEDAVRERYYGRMKLSEAKELYANSGHEVAVHAYTHPYLEKLKAPELMMEILEDRKAIEKEYGTITRGMAYPYGTYSDEVVDILGKCGIVYSRTVKSTETFSFPENWLTLHPTCHHNCPNLMILAKKFAEDEIRNKAINKMFYLWGHSYEFDNNDNWNVIENFCEYIGNREDIWYATNIEIYDYIKAYEALQVSVDGKTVCNPTTIDVWFMQDNEVYCVHGGETICL